MPRFRYRRDFIESGQSTVFRTVHCACERYSSAWRILPRPVKCFIGYNHVIIKKYCEIISYRCWPRPKLSTMELIQCLIGRIVQWRISRIAWPLELICHVCPQTKASVQLFVLAQSFVSKPKTKYNKIFHTIYDRSKQAFTWRRKTCAFRLFLSSSDVKKGTAVRSGIRSWHIFSWIPTQSAFWCSTSLK